MPSITDTDAPRPRTVPRCREHPVRQTGCKDCRKREAFLCRLRRWERAHGVDTGFVDSAPVREHLAYLVEHGNRTTSDIAAEAGLDSTSVRDVMLGRRTRMFAVNARALLAVQPRTTPPLRYQSMVPAVEGIRLLQALLAQGWSCPFLARQLGGISGKRVHSMVTEGQAGMLPTTLDRIRYLVRTLGRYDIRYLDKPLPGMNRRTVNSSAAHGWPTLTAWRGLDIADPDITPDTAVADVEDDDTDMGFFRLTIDRTLRHHVQEIIEKIRLEWSHDFRYNRELWIQIPGTLSTFHEIVVWWLCEQAGLSDAQTARVIGYPGNDEREIQTGQRQMMRLQTKYRAARAWIDSDPQGETPDWYTLTPHKGGSRNFSRYLPVLIALHDAPFGAGWDLYELAKRCGVTEDEMVDYLTVAQSAGDMLPRRTARILNQQRHRSVPGARAA